MNEWILLAALVIALAFCALLVGFYAFYRAQQASHQAAELIDMARDECAAAVGVLQSRLDAMAAEMQESPRRLASEPLPGSAKPCMNLTRRSQALRLRRKGESPQRIAESLEIPRQEVDLLLKVHDIVLNNL